MKKKTVKLVVAVAALAVLCGAYAGISSYMSKKEKAESSEEEETSVSVVSSSADDIESVQFLIDKKEVTFEKKDDAWVKSDEDAFPVNQDTLDNAVGVFNDLKAERVLKDVDDLSQYGLDSPVNTISIKTKDGEETSIKIGSENESVSQYYVTKNDDDKTVYLVAAASVTPFMNTLYDYAQGGTFPEITSDNVEAIQVEGEKSYSLSKDEDGIWYVSDGEKEEKADSAKATSAASSLSTLEYASFVNYNASEEDMEGYGLSEPYADVTVKYKEEVQKEESEEDKDKDAAEDTEETDTQENVEEEPEMEEKTLVIHIGNEQDSENRYVSINDSKEVYTMSSETLSSLIGKENSDFWDMNVCYVSVNDLDAVEITYNGETKTVNVSRETSQDEDGNEKETITYKMDGKEIDSTAFDTFYNKFSNMTAQKRVTDDTSLNEEPEMKIVLEKTDGTEITVLYHSYDSNFYGVSVDDDKIYMVNKMNVKEMFEAYESLEGSDTTKNNATEKTADTSDSEE